MIGGDVVSFLDRLPAAFALLREEARQAWHEKRGPALSERTWDRVTAVLDNDGLALVAMPTFVNVYVHAYDVAARERDATPQRTPATPAPRRSRATWRRCEPPLPPAPADLAAELRAAKQALAQCERGDATYEAIDRCRAIERRIAKARRDAAISVHLRDDKPSRSAFSTCTACRLFAHLSDAARDAWTTLDPSEVTCIDCRDILERQQRAAETAPAPQRHRLLVFGPIGQRALAYLDVPAEQAAARYAARGGSASEEPHVVEFEDEFQVWAASEVPR